MTLDEQLFASIRKHAADGPNRFETAKTLLMSAASEATKDSTRRPPNAKPGGIRFYMPKAVDEAIDDLVRAIGMAGHRSNRSEVVRAGIRALQRLSRDELVSAVLAEQDGTSDSATSQR